MRKRTRRDTSETAIVDALEAVHATAVKLSGVPGLPDLLVCFRGVLYLLECKTGKGKLTPDQQTMRANLRFTIVRTPDEALAAIGAVPGAPALRWTAPVLVADGAALNRDGYCGRCGAWVLTESTALLEPVPLPTTDDPRLPY